jgi:hypothetical protein
MDGLTGMSRGIPAPLRGGAAGALSWSLAGVVRGGLELPILQRRNAGVPNLEVGTLGADVLG